jgi:hypothetical protein
MRSWLEERNLPYKESIRNNPPGFRFEAPSFACEPKWLVREHENELRSASYKTQVRLTAARMPLWREQIM